MLGGADESTQLWRPPRTIFVELLIYCFQAKAAAWSKWRPSETSRKVWPNSISTSVASSIRSPHFRKMVKQEKVDSTEPENTHHRGKYHCTADPLFYRFGYWTKKVKLSFIQHKINRRSAVQRYFPLSQCSLTKLMPCSHWSVLRSFRKAKIFTM